VSEEFIPVRPPRPKRKYDRKHRSNRNNRRPKGGGPTAESKLMLGILSLLVMRGKYKLYEGTVPAKVIARRRTKNRVAKQSRKANRAS
jgi:hypothetical protein